MAMGFAIPKAMIQQALAEISVDPSRTKDQLLASALDLYVSPQFQGRADKHEGFLSLLAPHLSADVRQRFAKSLANWTGYIE
jgi:hypothetical protein